MIEASAVIPGDVYLGAEGSDLGTVFDTMPEQFGQARPGYPSDLFDSLCSQLPAAAQVLEIGPETGKATAELAARDLHITAI
ncbi:MAG: hypothetical protein KGJ62_01005 [Armatimonadetes bacterium]|nr:hypothetical protein [Armatimonadota bacterium]MDE2207778.1 hypothetical protein [Armatimonadota bacterium]